MHRTKRSNRLGRQRFFDPQEMWIIVSSDWNFRLGLMYATFIVVVLFFIQVVHLHRKSLNTDLHNLYLHC